MANKELVAIYSYVTICSVIYGILAAHVPFLIGIPWTTCDHCSSKLGCILLFHLFDGPLAIFNLYVAWFGLKRLSDKSLKLFLSLLSSVFTVNIAFFCFECLLIFSNLRSFTPSWENILLASVAVMLLGGSALALYVKQKLLTATQTLII